MFLCVGYRFLFVKSVKRTNDFRYNRKLGLTLISVIITPFSAGGVLYGRDDAKHNLFLPALLLTEQDEKLVLGLSVFILFSYFLLFPYIPNLL